MPDSYIDSVCWSISCSRFHKSRSAEDGNSEFGVSFDESGIHPLPLADRGNNSATDKPGEVELQCVDLVSGSSRSWQSM